MDIFNAVTQKKASMLSINGVNCVKNFGDFAAEYEALRNGTIIYDCGSYGIFRIEGNEAGTYLETLSTKDVAFMNIGMISESYFLNDDAEIVGMVFIVKRENDYLLLTSWEFVNNVSAWLNQTCIDFDVQITNMSNEYALLAVEGPKSWKVVKDLFSTEVENISLYTYKEDEYMHKAVSIMRIGRTSEYAYMLLTKPEVGKTMYQKVLDYRENCDFLLEEAGFDCLELAMLEIHQPNFWRETKEFGNIFELSQQWYLRYDKEFYRGTEAIVQMLHDKSVKASVCFMTEDDTVLPPRTSITNEDNEVIGEVIYALYAPKLKKSLGVAILVDPYAQSGLTFEAKLTDTTKKIKTVSAPIIRPISWDTKME